jgi:hypothetical protein
MYGRGNAINIIEPTRVVSVRRNTFKQCVGAISISQLSQYYSSMYFQDNYFTDNRNTIRIENNEDLCVGSDFQILFLNNTFWNNAGNYVVSIEKSAYDPIPKVTPVVALCSFVFNYNTFSGNSITANVAETLFNVRTIGPSINANTFGYHQKPITYIIDPIYEFILDAQRNNWNTMDYRIIEERIEHSSGTTVSYNPIYYQPTDSYFDVVDRCFVIGQIDCITDYYCSDVYFNETNVCRSLGSCIAPDVCLCKAGVSGTFCETYTCYGIYQTNQMVCGGHGECTDIDTCVCTPGYSGSQCDQFSCYGINSGDDSSCSGHGICTKSNHCECNNGYTGVNCDNQPPLPEDSPQYSSQFPVESSNLTSNSQLPTISSGRDSSSEQYSSSSEIPAPPELSSTFSGQSVIPSMSESIRCLGIIYSDINVCSSQGICVETDQCVCFGSYTGLNCNETSVDHSISIQLVSNNIPGRVFNRAKQLHIVANLSPADKISEMKMYWTVYKVPNTLLDINALIADGVSIQSRSIIFKENALQSNTEYLVMFNVKYCNSSSNYIPATMEVKTSALPITGTLDVDPVFGIAYNTTFRLQATNWLSNTGPLLYSFGYIRNNERITLVPNNYSLSYFDTILPDGSVNVFVTASVLYGEPVQMNYYVDVVPSTVPVLNFVQNRLNSIATSNQFDSDVTIITSAIRDSASTWNQTTVVNIIDSIVRAVEQRVNNSQVAPETQIQTIRVITDCVSYFSPITLGKVTTILTNVVNHISVYNDETLPVIVAATRNLASPLLDKISSIQNRGLFVQLVNAFSPLVRKTLIEGQEKSLSFENIELLYSHTSRSPSTDVVLNIPEPNSISTSRRRLTNENIQITLSNELYSSNTMTNVPSLLVVASVYENPIYEYTENNETTIVSSTISFSLYDSATDQQLVVNDITSLFTSSVPVIVEETMDKNRTHYVCKYWDKISSEWSNSTICTTLQPTFSNPMVICNCSQPVTHLVSLDYIQAVTEETENPPTPPSNRKLGTAGIVLIILACLTPLAVMIIAAIAIVWYLLDWNNRSKQPVYTPNQLDVVVQMLFSKMFKRQYNINL